MLVLSGAIPLLRPMTRHAAPADRSHRRQTFPFSEGLVAAIAGDQAQMISALATALAVKDHVPLQEHLKTAAGIAPDQPALVSPDRGHTWLELRQASPVNVFRTKDGSCAEIDLETLLPDSPLLGEHLQDAMRQSSAVPRASALLRPLLDMRVLPSRGEFRRLYEWAPLLEHHAYRCASRLVGLLDMLRPHLHTSGDPDIRGRLLLTYWCGMHIMGQMVLLASDFGARVWLSDMARRVPWNNWTPTFPLMRERTVWLAGCAARSVIAFGPGVVDPYFARLASANHPTKIFDALFALSAVAISQPGESDAIRRQIELLKAATVNRQVQHMASVQQAYEDALHAIDCAPECERSTRQGGDPLGQRASAARGLATPGAMRCDPAGIADSRRFLGFSVIGDLVAARAERFFPAVQKSQRPLPLKAHEMLDVFHRAWGFGEVPASATTSVH